MAVAVWAGQTASGGLSVAETEERRIAVAKDGKGWCEEGRGDQGPKAPQSSQGDRGPGRTGIA